MISSTIFLAAVLNAEELTANAPVLLETDGTDAELVEQELTSGGDPFNDERRLTSGRWYWWECNNGDEWVKSKYVCDGVCDCTDCSDEWSGSQTKSDCPYTNAVPLPWSAARAASRGELDTGRRLEEELEEPLLPAAVEEPEQRRADGVTLPPPAWYWWECNNGDEWVKSKYVCDGVCDCTDCSDEWSGYKTKSHCPYTNANPLPWSAARAASRGELEGRRLEDESEPSLVLAAVEEAEPEQRRSAPVTLPPPAWYWWECNNGDEWVKSKYVCDGVCDCTDCSDEWSGYQTKSHCPYTNATPLPWSAARAAARGELETGRRLEEPEQQLVLEAVEEPEPEQRRAAPVTLPPPAWYWWECNNGDEWIKSKYVCDGVCDCTDCSDEWEGSQTKSRCPYTNAFPLPWSAARAASRGEIDTPPSLSGRRLEEPEQRRLVPGQCRCTDGSTGMVTAQGCLDRRSHQKCDLIPGQCQCSDGSTGMRTAHGCLDRHTRQQCDRAPGQCTCSDGSTGMVTAHGCLDRRTRHNCDLMPGQCTCSDGTTGFVASGGDCVCDGGRLFGR